ncbi:DUF1963 domain-containing protein [Shewanella schlegeliana]|uniref:DUF1963 domain-containing protein n=1 Tax=Shewanella schlegeliana TaxID=190308 RepID=A0ABS1T0N6_9GAMM|nr:DUF1963 domain-containing protein [Shewanella schlegeliana]MBL4914356.1 DUF1963 domain-containing protein [Shewanella schlegeliana]MCL1109421.1 DUF1963 domain-containing protein [Shewanella schlegeliana]
MLKEWFWIFKKIKSNEQFVEHLPALQDLLDAGQDIHERDGKGRSALEYVFAKPLPCVELVSWLLNQSSFDPAKEASLYPYSVDLPKGHFQLTKANNMMDRLDELMPSARCDLEDITEKARLAEPYLRLLAKFEQAGLTNQYQSGSEFYKQAFANRLESQLQLRKLEAQFDDLCVGFHMLAAEYDSEFQSRIAGAPWLPSSDSAIARANLDVINKDESLKLAFQINFAQLQGRNPVLPSKGLLQVYLQEPDEGEEPTGRCEAIFWTEADMEGLNWVEYPDRAITGDSLAPSGFDVSYRKAGHYPIRWQAYTQLPLSEAEITAAIDKNSLVIDPELYTDLYYDYGLMPRIEARTREVFTEEGTFTEEAYLPENHIAILSYLYTDFGSCIYSIPVDALWGDETDWRQLTHIFCYD